MKIEWWWIDGGICLIVLISALVGLARGLGDTLIRLIGVAGGLVFGVLFGDSAKAFLMTTPFKDTVCNRIFTIIRPDTGSTTEKLPDVIGDVVNDAADKAAMAAAEKLTESLMGIFGFLLIVITIWLVSTILRRLLRHGRRHSIIIGSIDSMLGLALGVVKGIIIACIAVAALIPVTTLVAPLILPDMITAIHDSYLASLVYENNPLLLAWNTLMPGAADGEQSAVFQLI